MRSRGGGRGGSRSGSSVRDDDGRCHRARLRRASAGRGLCQSGHARDRGGRRCGARCTDHARLDSIEDVPSDEPAPLVRTGRLTVAEGVRALGSRTDAIIICVPTPLGKSKEPDISHIVAAADEVARILRPGQLVVLESTTYPAPTEEVLLPALRRLRLCRWEAVLPRLLPRAHRSGQPHRTRSPTSQDCGRRDAGMLRARLRALTARSSSAWCPVSVAARRPRWSSSSRTSSAASTSRSSNELAIMCRRLGLSVWEIIDAAATKPFGFMPFYPGPGIGGHCSPSDPYYLLVARAHDGLRGALHRLRRTRSTAACPPTPCSWRPTPQRPGQAA